MIHIPVLLNEVKDFFSDIFGGVIIDATLGMGGHSYALLESNPYIKLICIDRDKEAIEIALKTLEPFRGRFEVINGAFGNTVAEIVRQTPNIVGLLADIGVSSYQLDSPLRGFGFTQNCLDMRMDLDSSLNAEYVVNSYSRDDLHRIFRDYGEIRNYEQVTNKILEARKNKRISTSSELSALFSSNKRERINPATLIFQAIRIEVNDELGELKKLLSSIESLKGAKVAIISFHSLEDRIVKDTFKAWARNCICNDSVYKCECGGNNAKGVVLTKKPIVPSYQEITLNKRSRSSKMRCFKFND